MKSRSNLTKAEIEAIINEAEVCHVSMVDENGLPYVLPFNFGYRDGHMYIHSGAEGKKIEIWAKNPTVCVAFSTGYQLRIQNEEVACSYSMRYRSVLVHGKVSQIDDISEKMRLLNVIMHKYTGKEDFTYSIPAISNVKVFEIIPEKIEGRIYGY
ncbi:MAG: pyridoxamine 5'-phosphate oxidase family protein [Bacteroidales bacterium]